MVRREQLIGNFIIWIAFAAVVSSAFMSNVFAGDAIMLLAMVAILAVAGVLATRTLVGYNVRAGSITPNGFRLNGRRGYLRQERVEHLVKTLDDSQLNELAWRLVYHDGDPAQLDRIVREYER